MGTLDVLAFPRPLSLRPAYMEYACSQVLSRENVQDGEKILGYQK
jgi:hypothetical protein